MMMIDSNIMSIHLVILCLEVRESCSLYIYIHIFLFSYLFRFF